MLQNPLTNARKRLVRRRFPAFMHAPRIAVEKQTGEKKVLVLLIDFRDNPHTYVSTFDSFVYDMQGSR